MRRSVARNVSLSGVLAVVVTVGAAAPSSSAPPVPPPPKSPVAAGYGGAVSSVDADATAAGIEVLRKGGNAVDAAVATAAALGVTEPYSAGLGGGGYFVHYDARTRTVETIDGRETAPRSADSSLFLENGKPIAFESAVTSGLGVGTPGTPATWDAALDAWGADHSGRSSSRPSGWPATDSSSTARSARRPRATGPGSPTSPPPGSSSCRAAPSPRSVRSSRTRTWRVRTRRSAARGSTRCTGASWPTTSCGPYAIRPWTPRRAGWYVRAI